MIGKTLSVSCRCVLRCCVVKEHQIKAEIQSKHDISSKYQRSAHKIAETDVIEDALQIVYIIILDSTDYF